MSKRKRWTNKLELDGDRTGMKCGGYGAMVVTNELGRGFNELLLKYRPWDWWSTWTFTRPYSAESASRCFEAFMRTLGHDTKYLYAIEANRTREGTHVHAVVGNVYSIRRDDTWARWFKRYGRCHIVPFNEHELTACGQYLSKYLAKGACWWNLSVPCQGELKLRHRPRAVSGASAVRVWSADTPRTRPEPKPEPETTVELVTTSRLRGGEHVRKLNERELQKLLWSRKGGRPCSDLLTDSNTLYDVQKVAESAGGVFKLAR